MKRLFARSGLAAVAVSWAILISATPAHADENWIITSYNSAINIATDSSLLVKEDIRVDFGGLQKHGIFRTIPVQYTYDSTHDRYYELSVQSVTDGTRPIRYSEYTQSGSKVIKIGDPSITVGGANRYVITYSVRGAMDAFADHDELFWNVDGGLWPVPKRSVSATVTVPPGSFQKAACYQGRMGSRESCTSTSATDTVTFASTRQLGSGEQMSAVTGLNKGAVNVPGPLLETHPRVRHFPQDDFDINPFTVGISALILIVGLGFIGRSWWVHGRDRAYLTQYYATNDPSQHAAPLLQHEAIAVEFAAPQNLRPAQLGLILDEWPDRKDVTATIVDLAVRGYLTITEVPCQKDWMFTLKDPDTSTLMPYEKTILNGLFTGRKEVNLTALKFTFHDTLREAEDELVGDAMSRKFFSFRPDYARLIWIGAGIGGIAVGIFLTNALGSFGWGLVGLAVLLVGMGALVGSKFMVQRTGAGRDVMQHTLGFRLYMLTAEKYRQQFAANAQIFTWLLPYAIVFGCVNLWAKAFEGNDISKSNNWYYGTAPFQAALLAGTLESMNSNISSAIALTPASTGGSSGFSSGGGFSGGGGGGGGGGSW